ncbi:hypothetical protein LCGC14_2698260, partial [marine sediment metagenome]
WNKEIDISQNLIQDLKNLDLCLEKRKSQGSPSKKEVQFNIDKLIKSKGSLFKLYLKRTEKIEKAKSLRESIIKDLKSWRGYYLKNVHYFPISLILCKILPKICLMKYEFICKMFNEK